MKKYIPQTWRDLRRLVLVIAFCVAAFFLVLGADPASAQGSDPVQSGSVGLTGTISAPPPSEGATITIPGSGQSFTELPIPVRGICPTGLLVKLFKNNVFAGSVQCENGTFSLEIDLFTGQNELIARVYDDLDQPGPDSNTVTVSFVDNSRGAGTRVSVTSNFAKRGVNPKKTLTWPIIISGGIGPYAINVDWGDGSTPDLISEPFPGTFDIQHVYENSGVYNIIVKVSDTTGAASFLQIVGVVNGPLSQTNVDPEAENIAFAAGKTRVVWWPSTITLPFIVSTFWLGKRYMLRVMKKRIERGEHPFADI